MRAPRRLAWLLVLLVLLACSEKNPTSDPGLDAMLHVTSAQFYRGDMPREELGPKVLNASLSGRAPAGEIDQACGGEAESATLAVAVALAGDAGYWIVRAKVPSAASPTLPAFQFSFSLATTTPPGTHQVILRAVDADGHFGPATVRPLDVTAPIMPVGNLVVSLTWQNQADLDLHLVLPSGLEIFKRNRTEYQTPPPSAGPVDPNAPRDGGVLDRDSNAQCVPDGQRSENVVWREPPPKGHYIARVDTFSLCGAPSAPWKLEVSLDNKRIAAAQGTGTENDLRFDHNRGGGVLAVEFDVP